MYCEETNASEYRNRYDYDECKIQKKETSIVTDLNPQTNMQPNADLIVVNCGLALSGQMAMVY